LWWPRSPEKIELLETIELRDAIMQDKSISTPSGSDMKTRASRYKIRAFPFIAVIHDMQLLPTPLVDIIGEYLLSPDMQRFICDEPVGCGRKNCSNPTNFDFEALVMHHAQDPMILPVLESRLRFRKNGQPAWPACGTLLDKIIVEIINAVIIKIKVFNHAYFKVGDDFDIPEEYYEMPAWYIGPDPFSGADLIRILVDINVPTHFKPEHLQYIQRACVTATEYDGWMPVERSAIITTAGMLRTLPYGYINMLRWDWVHGDYLKHDFSPDVFLKAVQNMYNIDRRAAILAWAASVGMTASAP
jgi:hypothetical protein